MRPDPGWIAAWRGLKHLHMRKSATYGTDDDRLANFTAVAQATGEPPELYVLERMLEKVTRSINMVKSGLADEVREYDDLSSLGLCAKALQQRRREIVLDPRCIP